MGNNYSSGVKDRSKGRVKVITRAQAEKQLPRGADPSQFMNHQNYHVKRKAWVLMGKPLPVDPADRAKFLKSLHLKEKAEPEVVSEGTPGQAQDVQ